LKLIEDRFQQQDAVILQMRMDNSELVNVVKRKEDELKQIRDFYADLDRKRKKNANAASTGTGKELLKTKKQVKDRDREIMRLNDKLRASRVQAEESRIKLEEVLSNKKPSRPLTAGGNASDQSVVPQQQMHSEQLGEKDQKIKEL
jgi:hypothetical protein